jgi:antitoxin component of MazEF toxin-antitoxin module
MKSKLIKIGNSRGVRLPEAVIEQVGLGNEIELEVRTGEVAIHPAKRKPREGWAASFKAMAAAGDDALLDDPLPRTKFDEGGWEPFDRAAGDLMEIDSDKIDNAVLALLSLGLHDDGRAWKGFDWDAMDRLHQRGFISDPRGKAKSVVFTEEGLKRSRQLLSELFSRSA